MTAENSPNPLAPDTVVLVHGFWVTPRSWEKWVERYEGRGYRVLTPTYPSNVKHYRHARSVTDYKEFPGRSHYSVIGHEGWEKVADYALEWATEHAATRPAS